jgi:hypothetical protein
LFFVWSNRMPIQSTTNHDVFLRTLLTKQVGDFDEFVDVNEIVELLPSVDRHLADEGAPLPLSVWRTLDYLERHQLVETKRDNPHVRLTPLGVYTALLFDVQKPKQASNG